VGLYGALSTILGVVLSGPLPVALVGATRPQPPGLGPELANGPVSIAVWPGRQLARAGS
jgi:hypothetical protein